MSRNVNRRNKYFFDRQVQGGILRQATLFWIYATVVYGAVMGVFRLLPAWLSGETVDFEFIKYQMAPIIVSSLVLFPVMLVTATRFSHRFAGPMFVFRRFLKQVNEGDSPNKIQLRKKDFWKDFASELNKIGDRSNSTAATK